MTIKHFDQEERKLWKSKKFFIFGFFLVSLIVAEIWVANTLANFGEKFESLNRLQLALEQDNRVLENEIAKYSSLQYIASQSATLGLKESKEIKYIYRANSPN